MTPVFLTGVAHRHPDPLRRPRLSATRAENRGRTGSSDRLAGLIWRLLGPDGRAYDSDRPGRLGGHRATRIYGRLDCRTALAALARGGQYRTQRVFFADEATAIAAGYRPCAVCLPGPYARWKAGPGSIPPRKDLTRSHPG